MIKCPWAKRSKPSITHSCARTISWRSLFLSKFPCFPYNILLDNHFKIMWQIPDDMEVGYVPLSMGGAYPGLYLCTSPSRFVRPVRNISIPSNGSENIEFIGPFEQVIIDFSFVCCILVWSYSNKGTYLYRDECYELRICQIFKCFVCFLSGFYGKFMIVKVCYVCSILWG